MSLRSRLGTACMKSTPGTPALSYHLAFTPHMLIQCKFVYSDARSAQVVDDRIRPALESGSKINSAKPTLVVVDEIDGATGGGENVREYKYNSAFGRRLLIELFDAEF